MGKGDGIKGFGKSKRVMTTSGMFVRFRHPSKKAKRKASMDKKKLKSSLGKNNV